MSVPLFGGFSNSSVTDVNKNCAGVDQNFVKIGTTHTLLDGETIGSMGSKLIEM
jgi:hypothetical protein